MSWFFRFTSFSVTAGQTYYVDALDQAAGGAGGEPQQREQARGVARAPVTGLRGGGSPEHRGGRHVNKS